MQLTRIPPYCTAASALDWLEGQCAILIDPDQERLELHRVLLAGSGGMVEHASTPCEVFGLDLEGEPRVTVLSTALGAFQLQAVAEYVRHRWPHTRILVIGQPEPHLEDYLYDEAVAEDCDPAEFVFAVKHCGQNVPHAVPVHGLEDSAMFQLTRSSGCGNFVRSQQTN